MLQTFDMPACSTGFTTLYQCGVTYGDTGVTVSVWLTYGDTWVTVSVWLPLTYGDTGVTVSVWCDLIIWFRPCAITVTLSVLVFLSAYYLSLKADGTCSVFALFRSYCTLSSRITLFINQQ